MTYSPPEYWTERGRGYEQEAVREGWHDVENQPVLELLDGLAYDSVLEVGCGFGRVGSHLLARKPTLDYVGIDVSEAMIDSFARRLGMGVDRLVYAADPGVPTTSDVVPFRRRLIVADLATWDTDRQWDLVLSVSVLGHLLPADIGAVLAKLRRLARHDFVHVDWNEFVC
jgi:SAM-dependent methyltransferase